MKIARIVSMIVMAIICVFFIVYGRTQTKLAMENASRANEALMDARKQADIAEIAAADARNAEAIAMEMKEKLELCQNENN